MRVLRGYGGLIVDEGRLSGLIVDEGPMSGYGDDDGDVQVVTTNTLTPAAISQAITPSSSTVLLLIGAGLAYWWFLRN